MTTKLSDLQRRCEHGFFHAHCDAHPGKGSHFGVVTHKGGCSGPSLVEVSDLVEALQAEDDAVVVTRGHWAGDGIAVTVAGHGRSFLVVPLGEDA